MTQAAATRARFTSFLVKVASRCNLDCDYCYVYHHADQGWRDMPRLLSAENRGRFAARLAEYASAERIERCAVIFHGGEPLLADAGDLASFAADIRAACPARVDFGLQTNGLLLDDAALDALEAADIGVSLSLDGPRESNDRHRTTRRGRSSFDKTMAALERLKRRPQIFSGVIAVIDAQTPPAELFAFFDAHKPPKLDFLLPDAHHERPPPGKASDPSRYERWLIDAFDLWLDSYPHLPVRTFEALLDGVSGLPSGTDAFGFGDVSLMSIETDGSYHDVDVLKVTRDGATRLGGTLADTSIASVAASPQIAAHQALLRREGLCDTCKNCHVVEICGGGSLPHRFGAQGFDNPTVYCSEMLALVAHVRARLNDLVGPSGATTPTALPEGVDLQAFDLAEDGASTMEALCESARAAEESALMATLKASGDLSDLALDVASQTAERRAEIATRPGVIAWRRARNVQDAGRMVQAIDGKPVTADAAYIRTACGQSPDEGPFAVADDDAWLRLPFGDAIRFETAETAEGARPLVDEALDIIRAWRPALAAEMEQACRAVQFVRDPLALPDKIVSFSDDSVPGALFVSVVQGDGFIDPYDLADSLVHEHRHQKLYLLERLAATVEPGAPPVSSPWREDPRPVTGLLHAVFVFVELRRFWLAVRDDGPRRLHNRAGNQVRETDRRLEEAFATLDGCPLTAVGRQLLDVLKSAARDKSATSAAAA